MFVLRLRIITEYSERKPDNVHSYAIDIFSYHTYRRTKCASPRRVFFHTHPHLTFRLCVISYLTSGCEFSCVRGPRLYTECLLFLAFSCFSPLFVFFPSYLLTYHITQHDGETESFSSSTAREQQSSKKICYFSGCLYLSMTYLSFFFHSYGQRASYLWSLVRSNQ